jgi:PAS domain S-box-containing protein
MDDAGIRVELTPEERAFLEELGPIQMAVDPDWMPYEYVTEDGDFIGIAPDLLDLIARRLDIQFEVIPTRDWEETLEIGRAGKSHIIPFLNQTAERDEWLLFTDPYFINPNVFVTREGHDFISDPRALQNKTIVLPSGTSIEQWVRRDFPNLEVITVETEAETFRYVEERRADMTLRSLTMAAYVIKQEGWFNLKIAGEVPEYANHLRIGVNKELPMLRDILNQGIATITPAEVQEAVNRYVSIQIVQRQNRRLALRISGIAFLVLALSLFWNHRLQKVSVALYESERSKSVLLANLPGIAYRCKFDEHWTMEFISEGCMKLTGYPSEALLYNRDLSFSSLIAHENRDDLQKACEQAVANKTNLQLEYRLITRNGEEKWVYEQATPLFDKEGRLECLEGMIIDISDRKSLETQMLKAKQEAEEAAAAKARFLAMMSHEIRTPLNGIIGLSRIMTESGLPEEETRKATLIRESGEHLLEIINDILDFSRLEAGKMTLELQPVALRNLFEKLHSMFEHSACEKNLRLVLSIDRNLPETLLGDAKRLRQVFTNLIGNAIKFTEKGQVSIIITSQDSPNPDEVEVCFKIIDTGCGIPEDQQEGLFKEFTQANVGTYRKYGGTGLGLAICKQLIDLMGGKISLESVPDRGCLFEVTLPFALCKSPEADSNLSEPFLPPPKNQSAKALIVDDNGLNLELSRDILQKLGLDVVTACRGIDALETLNRSRPAIIFMDVEMPSMDGIETVRIFRDREKERYPSMPPVPIVALTAHDPEDISARCENAGINRILTKPVEPSQICSVLIELL